MSPKKSGRGKKRKKGRGSAGGGMPRYVPWLILLAVVLGGYAVWYIFFAESSGGEASAACVLLIDRTASSAGDERTDDARSIARRAVEGCAEREAILQIYYFDQENPGITHADLDQSDYDLFPPEGLIESKQDNAVEEAVRDAQDAVDSVFEIPPGDAEQRSDILQSVVNASEVLQNVASSEGVDDIHLIVITDGFQLGSSVTVEDLAGESSPADLVERAVEVDLIPDVDGVQVTFAGVRSGDFVGSSGEVDDDFEAAVAEFWRLVIEDEGAGRLCDYGDDPGPVPAGCGGGE